MTTWKATWPRSTPRTQIAGPLKRSYPARRRCSSARRRLICAVLTVMMSSRAPSRHRRVQRLVAAVRPSTTTCMGCSECMVGSAAVAFRRTPGGLTRVFPTASWLPRSGCVARPVSVRGLAQQRRSTRASSQWPGTTCRAAPQAAAAASTRSFLRPSRGTAAGPARSRWWARRRLGSPPNL